MAKITQRWWLTNELVRRITDKKLKFRNNLAFLGFIHRRLMDKT
jgi:hypothetical protein